MKMKRTFKWKDIKYVERIKSLSVHYDAQEKENGNYILQKKHRYLMNVKSGKPIWFDFPVRIETFQMSNEVVAYRIELNLVKIFVIWTCTALLWGLLGLYFNFYVFIVFLIIWFIGIISLFVVGQNILDEIEYSVKQTFNS